MDEQQACERKVREDRGTWRDQGEGKEQGI